MGARRRARECALQMLFEYDLSANELADIMRMFWEANPREVEIREFANELFSGAAGLREQIDPLIRMHAQHWRLERMAAVDRNILRLAVFELLKRETPPAVVIDEALEIAKKYSSDESSQFINGVLDAIHKDLQLKPETLKPET
ncbi:MAG: transcription antitermination factor NusB [Acidobacteria bacterium]|nr:transcription antitermination factor NusB [Acidobacteriota bacterium]